jgi:protein-tyrosine phosphatase
MIYRSEKLSELSDADLATLQRLGLSLVCDFRGPTEREGAPDRLPEGAQYAAMRIISDEDFPDATDIRGIVTSGELSNFDLAQLLIDMNRAFVEKYPHRYRELFDRLGSPESYPLLMHCSAGKDRTGFAAAMILSALGVPRETIMEDFLLTNHYAAEKVQKQAWKIRIFSLFRVDPEDLMPVLTVTPRYLEVAFEAIDEQYGSTERFLREAIGLSDEEIAALRDRLLRPPL